VQQDQEYLQDGGRNDCSCERDQATVDPALDGHERAQGVLGLITDGPELLRDAAGNGITDDGVQAAGVGLEALKGGVSELLMGLRGVEKQSDLDRGFVHGDWLRWCAGVRMRSIKSVVV